MRKRDCIYILLLVISFALWGFSYKSCREYQDYLYTTFEGMKAQLMFHYLHKGEDEKAEYWLERMEPLELERLDDETRRIMELLAIANGEKEMRK